MGGPDRSAVLAELRSVRPSGDHPLHTRHGCEAVQVLASEHKGSRCDEGQEDGETSTRIMGCPAAAAAAAVGGGGSGGKRT